MVNVATVSWDAGRRAMAPEMEEQASAAARVEKEARRAAKEARRTEKETRRAEKQAKKSAKAMKHAAEAELEQKPAKKVKSTVETDSGADIRAEASSDQGTAADREARQAATEQYLRQCQAEQQRAEAERAAKKEQRAEQQRVEAERAAKKESRARKQLAHESPKEKPKFHEASKGVKAGDWSCGVCNANVFASKSACFKCGAAKGAEADFGDLQDINAICKDCNGDFVVTAREQFFFKQKGFTVCVRVRCTPCSDAKKQRYGSNYGAGGFGGGGCGGDTGSSVTAPSNRCFNCAQIGHISRDCPQARKTTACYYCGEEGHISKNCPSAPSPGACFHCGQTGHISRNCPSGGAGQCFKCGGRGHMASDCTAPPKLRL